MPNNGDANKLISEIVDSLVFPDSYEPEETALMRKRFKDDSGFVEAILDIDELFQFIMGTPGVERETKEQVVAGLRHYLGTEGTAYAALVGLYLIELSEAIPDNAGFRVIFKRLAQFELESI